MIDTLYYSEPRRGKDADIEAGVLVHDNLKSLYHFKCTHAECNAHILRYLKGAVEISSRRWSQKMIDFLLKTKTAAKENNLTHSEILEYHRQYDEILEYGRAEFLRDEKPNYHGDDMKLLRHLKEYKAQHLLFYLTEAFPLTTIRQNAICA